LFQKKRAETRVRLADIHRLYQFLAMQEHGCFLA
jgi:hypothetical protein